MAAEHSVPKHSTEFYTTEVFTNIHTYYLHIIREVTEAVKHPTNLNAETNTQ
jgi:hypothetical protein